MDIEKEIDDLKQRIAKLELANVETTHIIDTSKPTQFKTGEAIQFGIPVVDAGPINKIIKGNK